MNLDEVEAKLNKKQPPHSTRQRIVPGDGDRRHGTKNGYGNLGCRCDECRQANTDSHREWTHTSGTRVPMEEYRRKQRENPPPHGTETRYQKPWKCRCYFCKLASSVSRATRRTS